MSNMFLIGDSCGGLLPLVSVLYKIITVFQIAIPILLILYGTIDLGKAVIASEEKEVKAAQSRLIKRIIYAALIFFVPMIVFVIMDVVAAGTKKDSISEANTTDWANCWRQAKGK